VQLNSKATVEWEEWLVENSGTGEDSDTN